MKSKVYFIEVDGRDTKEGIKAKFCRLLEESNVFDFIRKGDRAAIKLHFGEEGNTGYVNPEYVRLAVDNIAKRQGRPFLADTNTLYRGRRTSSKEHLSLACEHGFREDITGAGVLIPDDTRRGSAACVKINQKFIKTARVAAVFLQADAIIGIAHFKGHLMTGFGGALKNLGMGCATREGKLAQHSDISPYVNVKPCVGCGECEKVCPAQAIVIVGKKSRLDPAKCIGCASCVAACQYNAIDINWESGAGNIQEKMIEYAKAVLSDKKGKAAFINFAVKITKECDCIAKDDPRISPDIGILASKDPVSIDKASLDLAVKIAGRDIFKEAHPARDYRKQLYYGSEIGLGNLEYELISLSAFAQENHGCKPLG